MGMATYVPTLDILAWTFLAGSCFIFTMITMFCMGTYGFFYGKIEYFSPFHLLANKHVLHASIDAVLLPTVATILMAVAHKLNS